MNRLIIRHKGPAGRGIPAGGSQGQILVKKSSTDHDTDWASPPDGTDAVSGPSSAADNNVAAFQGESGKRIKDSGVPISSLATTAQLGNKVDKVSGKGLSDQNFTLAEKNKLAALAGRYRGSFEDLAAVNAHTFNPAPAAGDWCLIEEVSEAIILVIWDNTNLEWTEFTLDSVTMTGPEIADALFNTGDAGAYAKDLCRIFTSTDKANLDLIVSQLTGIIDGLTDLSFAFGSCGYFSLTGTETTITSISNGTSNMVKVDASTTLDVASVNFDSPVDNRLRYTGTTTRMFRIAANISVGGATAGDVLVVAVRKNGSLLTQSRVLDEVKNTEQISSITTSCFVSLATNDYIEVLIGNTSGTNNPTVFALTLEAAAV